MPSSWTRPELPDRGAKVLLDGALAELRTALAASHAEPPSATGRSRLLRRGRARRAEDGGSTSGGAAARVKELADSGEYARAAALGLVALEQDPADVELLRTTRGALSATGSVTAALHVAEALKAVAPTARLDQQIAAHRLRLAESEPGWRPEVDPRYGPVEPVPDRILHLLKVSLPYRQSGYTVRTRYTLAAQKAAGLDPVAVTALGFPREIGVTDFPAIEDVHGVRHHRLDLGPSTPTSSSPDYLLAYANAAAAIVQDTRPSVIHVHSGHRGFENALVGLALGRAFELPVVYEVRGFFESLWTTDPRWAEQGELYERWRAAEENCFREAAAVVTLSEGMREEIIARGVPPEKVFTVPNGVDPEVFRPQPRNEALVADLGLNGAFTYGYIGNLDHYREGHELLIEATARLRSEDLPVKCLLVGDGKRRGALEALAQDLGVSDAVVFTGRVPHAAILDYYSVLDAFVLPRIDERAARLVTPLKPYEAMACGVPLVTSDLPALAEVIGEGARGVTFRAGDPAALAGALLHVRNNPAECRQLSDRALDWARRERGWLRNGPRHSALYAEIV